MLRNADVTVAALVKQGVTFERYDFMKQILPHRGAHAMNQFHRLLIVPVATLAVGCGKIRDMVTDMVHVQRCAVQRSGTTSVNMSLGTGKRFTLGLVNSPLDTLPAQARAAAARNVAQCIRENYRRYPELTDVAITFVHRTGTGVAKVSVSTTPLVFAMKDLGTAAPTSDSATGQTKAPN